MSSKKLKKSKGLSVLKKILVIAFCVLLTIMLLSVIYSAITVFIPYLSITLFQETGISITEGLTFAEFSVGDMVVLCMMWLLPSLAGTLIVTFVLWSVIKWSIHKITNVIANNFFKKDESKVVENQEGDTVNEYEISGEA